LGYLLAPVAKRAKTAKRAKKGSKRGQNDPKTAVFDHVLGPLFDPF